MWNAIFESHKQRNGKCESSERLSEIFGCVASKKRDSRVYQTTPVISTKVLPIHHISIYL